MNFTEREIIEGCIRKEEKFQRLLYDKYSPQIFGICRKNARSKEDAEDIFQDGFIKLFSSLHKYSFAGSFEGWLRIFFMRVAWNYYRDKKDKYPKTEITDTLNTGVENMVLDKFSNEQLVWALEQLGDKERMVFVMSEVEDVDLSTVALQTGLKEVTIRSMNSRTKKKLLNYFFKI